MKDEDHLVEVDRLWLAIKRDFFAAVESFAGLNAPDSEHRWKRLLKNWQALCELNIDIAANLLHGFEQIEMAFGETRSTGGTPSEVGLRRLSEVVGIVEIGRNANPDAKVETVGELIELGEQQIQRELDDDLGEFNDGS